MLVARREDYCRKVEKYVDFGFVRVQCRRLYGETGNPSIDPVVFFKAEMIGGWHGQALACPCLIECRPRTRTRPLANFWQAVYWRWYYRLSRRSQKVNSVRLYKLLSTGFALPRPRITHSEGWLKLNPGHLPGRAGCGNSACPDL